MAFALFALLIAFLLATGIASTPSASLFTEEPCENDGVWTIWTNVHNSDRPSDQSAEETYQTLYEMAKRTCLPPMVFQVDAIVSTKRKRASLGEQYFTQLISQYAQLLKTKDFRFRYCCPREQGVTETDTIDETSITSTVSVPTTTMNKTEIGASSLTSPDGAICGQQEIKPRTGLSARIFGGANVIPNSWPWMISYSEKTNDCGEHSGPCKTYCGGTLISRYYVLTAAHCVTAEQPSDIELVAGMHRRSSFDEMNTRQSRIVRSIHLHPNFDQEELTDDIALLRVDLPFEFNTYVQPACLSNIDPQPNDLVTILGWGAESLETGIVDTLKQASTTVIGGCQSYWGPTVSNKQICIANRQTGDSSCRGDSGGPLLMQLNGQYVVSGISSFTNRCTTLGERTAPNVYTRVSSYQSWMKEIMQDD